MAVCKIIPIKQAKGIKQCADYISDENKVISVKKDETTSFRRDDSKNKQEEELDRRPSAEISIDTVLAYMKNDEKTHHPSDAQKKYISGYMCPPENATQEFLRVKEQNLASQGKTLLDETGNWAYHIIQSFPEELNISDDEVHQCGRELCEKLALYQAVICSHVHPVINEDSEISGKCKHNHILINSHIHPDKLDKENPGVYKYNDCNESYAQLQKWNDEISLAHGLPIIRNPELNKKYSWFKSKMENENASWTAQVAKDIKNTMRFCSNWEEFKTQMTEQGYFIRETGKNITYYTPEHSETHKQQIRESRLGREYTKAAMERYWTTVGQQKESQAEGKEHPSRAALIRDLIKQYGANLFAEVEVKNKNKTYTLDVPLKNPHHERALETINTYFEAEKRYNLCTYDNVPILEVTGQDLFDYYAILQQERERKEKKKGFYQEKDEFYSDSTKVSSETNNPYKVRLWDENGRRRTKIELTCLLAIGIIQKEHPIVDAPPDVFFSGTDGKHIYAKVDKKLQNMYDTMTLANQMKVENSADVTKKLDRAGKEVARTRKQLKHLTEQYNQMKTIADYLAVVESVSDICERIYNMPESEGKEAAELAYAAELAQYKTAKRYLHTKNINSEEDIKDFKKRYESTSAHLKEVQKDFETFNQEYRSLKKIEYNLTLAQNKYYCYGPTHAMFENEQSVQKQEQDNEQEPEQNTEKRELN